MPYQDSVTVQSSLGDREFVILTCRPEEGKFIHNFGLLSSWRCVSVVVLLDCVMFLDGFSKKQNLEMIVTWSQPWNGGMELEFLWYTYQSRYGDTVTMAGKPGVKVRKGIKRDRKLKLFLPMIIMGNEKSLTDKVHKLVTVVDIQL